MKDLASSQPEFGTRLRLRRTQLGMSQKELAGEDVTPSYISLLENGSRAPSLAVVIRLARLLRTTPQELLGFEIEGLAPATGREQPELVTQLEVRRLADMGDLAGARAILQGRLESARARGDHEAMLTYGLELLGILTAAGDQPERLALLDELDKMPIVERTPGARIMLGIDRASTLRELGRIREAHAVARRTLDALPATQMVGSSEQVRLLGVLAAILTETGDFDQARTVIEEMVALARQAGHVGILGRTHWVASMAMARMGRVDDAYAQLRSAHETLVAGSMPVRDWLRFCRFTASILLERGHDIEDARAWIDTAELTAKMAGLASDYACARRERAHYELTAGHAAEAVKIYEELLDTAMDTMGGETVVVYSGLSDALAMLGRYQEAIDWQRRAAEIYEADENYRRAAESWRKIDALRQKQEQQ